jgi:phage tail protein X
MTDTKWTPGPWEVRTENGAIRVYYGKTIAITDQMFEANAHLVAAAPELYEALKAMADDYEEFVYNPATDRWDVPLFNKPVHDMARAALAKARGETP